MEENRACLILREYDLRFVSVDYLDQMEALIAALESKGYSPCFLPFSSEDERYLDQIGLSRRLPIERQWWNPCRAKQVIACSGLTISVGRLHPLIFAAEAGARVAALVSPLPVYAEAGTDRKLKFVSEELGVALFSSTAELIDSLDRIGPATPERVAASKARLSGMISALRSLFAEASSP